MCWFADVYTVPLRRHHSFGLGQDSVPVCPDKHTQSLLLFIHMTSKAEAWCVCVGGGGGGVLFRIYRSNSITALQICFFLSFFFLFFFLFLFCLLIAVVCVCGWVAVCLFFVSLFVVLVCLCVCVLWGLFFILLLLFGGTGGGVVTGFCLC